MSGRPSRSKSATVPCSCGPTSSWRRVKRRVGAGGASGAAAARDAATARAHINEDSRTRPPGARRGRDRECWRGLTRNDIRSASIFRGDDMADRPFRPGRSGVSRRTFLKTAGAGAAVTGLAPSAPAAAPPPVMGPDAMPLTLRVNGVARALTVEPRVTLLRALRNHLDLTGAKEVCDRGGCGACTVLVDGKPVASCLMLAVDAEGREVTTVEGLG